MYTIFKNTGIQYFGNPEVDFSSDLELNQLVESVDGKASLAFARRLLINEWTPLSLDGQRNLLRICFLFIEQKSRNIFAIDTKISDDPKYFFTQDDISEVLYIMPELKDQTNHAELINNIPVLDDTVLWLESIKERKKNELISQDADWNNYSPITAYKLLISEYIKNCDHRDGNQFLPELKLLSDTDAALNPIKTSLILDFGNSRSIGLFVEINDADMVEIKNSCPLKLIDYDKISKEGINHLQMDSVISKTDNYLTSSKIKFKKNTFTRYPDTTNFNYPSMAVMGSEADNFMQSQNDSPTGISGPKRYLWANKNENMYWNFYGTDEAIVGDALKYIPIEDSDELIEDGQLPQGLTRRPITPVYPKRSLMIFAMMEIIYQAYCQVNSMHYRDHVGRPRIRRTLNNIILSFPTAMPFWERERFLKQAQKAMAILIKMNVLSESINIELGSDEASCSQIAFLYAEASKFKNNMGKFIKLVNSDDNADKIRIASLDIGGGTTDLSICEYSLQNPGQIQNPNMNQELIYSDGIYKAGDDILEKFISDLIIPKLRHAKSDEGEDKFPSLFGTGAPQRDREKRIDVLDGLFVPIALFYFYLLENSVDMHNEPIETLSDLNEFLISKNLKGIKDFDKFNLLTDSNLLTLTDFYELPIAGLIPSLSELEEKVIEVISSIIKPYSVVINKYNPAYLLLAGKTCALPIISQLLQNWLTISPSRILPLCNYYIGDWYPFAYQGVVSDPKTAVVVGNAISYFSNNNKLDINIFTKGQNTDYTLNFIGSAPEGMRKIQNNAITYKTTDGNKQIIPVQLTNKANILFRNIDHPSMECSLMYKMHLGKENNNDLIIPGGGSISVDIDYANPKKRLEITAVSGEVQLSNDSGSRRAAKISDIVLSEQTMYDDEYFLDHGKFNLSTN